MAEKKQSESVIIEKEAKASTSQLLDLIGVKADIEVQIGEESIGIDIEGDDLGLLIGYKGENVENLQLLLGLIINKKLGLENWRPVSVDVSGWRKQREDSLKVLLQKEIEKIKNGQESVNLPPMSPSERRLIHILVSDMGGYVSESSGEGSDRYVVVKKVD